MIKRHLVVCVSFVVSTGLIKLECLLETQQNTSSNSVSDVEFGLVTELHFYAQYHNLPTPPSNRT